MQDIGLDILLTVITLIIAIVGVVWDKPPLKVKITLIALAVLASGATVLKISKDESDKKFFEHALTSTLAPSNSEYQRMEDEIGAFASGRHFDDGPCHHSNDGLICLFFNTKNQSAHATLVFNHDEVGKMYANNLAGKPNVLIIKDAFDKTYPRFNWNEEFVDKVGALGLAVCFNMFEHWGDDYNYDPSFGLKVQCDSATGSQSVQFTEDQLRAMPDAKAADLFYYFEQRFREQYAQTPTQLKIPRRKKSKRQ